MEGLACVEELGRVQHGGGRGAHLQTMKKMNFLKKNEIH